MPLRPQKREIQLSLDRALVLLRPNSFPKDVANMAVSERTCLEGLCLYPIPDSLMLWLAEVLISDVSIGQTMISPAHSQTMSRNPPIKPITYWWGMGL